MLTFIRISGPGSGTGDRLTPGEVASCIEYIEAAISCGLICINGSVPAPSLPWVRVEIENTRGIN